MTTRTYPNVPKEVLLIPSNVLDLTFYYVDHYNNNFHFDRMTHLCVVSKINSLILNYYC